MPVAGLGTCSDVMSADQTQKLDIKRGPIIISRHGKPALDRNAGPRIDWRSYRKWWNQYEEGSLAEGQSAPDVLKSIVSDADLVLTSQRPRAIETAKLAAPHMEPVPRAIFNEAPLPPPRFRQAKYLPKTWNILARTAWVWGHSLDGESVTEARVRAAEAARELHDAAIVGKVYLAAHGWFNRMIRKELKKLGWKCTRNGGDSYWSYRVYVYRGQR